MTPEELFEPIVMFFRLTNLPAIFQTIMNKILWDLINTGEVVSFIDDVIVRTEGKKRHDEVVEEVVKMLVENDLYVKLEKCRWNIREVEFLGVVIGLDRIKIEEEKAKDVQDQLILKEVKDVQKFLGIANYYWQFIKDFTVIARQLHDIVKNQCQQHKT